MTWLDGAVASCGSVFPSVHDPLCHPAVVNGAEVDATNSASLFPTLETLTSFLKADDAAVGKYVATAVGELVRATSSSTASPPARGPQPWFGPRLHALWCCMELV